MLSENFEMPKPEIKPAIPEDTYTVVIKDITDLQVPDFTNPEQMVTRLKFDFEVIEGEYKGSMLYKRVSPKFAPSKNGRPASNLFIIATKAFKTQVNRDEFKLESLIGKQLRVVVNIVEKDGNEYNNITNFMELKKDVVVTANSKDEISLDDIPF